MSARSQRIELITRGERRRRWSVEQKREIAAESLEPGISPITVARRYGISSGLLYTWRRHLLDGSLGVTRQPVAKFARVEVMAIPADPAPAKPQRGEHVQAGPSEMLPLRFGTWRLVCRSVSPSNKDQKFR